MMRSTRRTLAVAFNDFLRPQSKALLIVWGLLTVLLAWGMSLGAIQVSSGSSGVGGVKSHLTSEFSQALQGAVLAVMIDGFFFAVLAGMGVPRDHETRIHDVLRSTGLSPRSYVAGKYLAAVGWLAVMIALQIVGRIVFNHLIPNADLAESRGPLSLANYARPMLLVVAPGLLFTGAVSFFLGARTKNGVIVFLSPVFLILAYTFLFSETLLKQLPKNVRETIVFSDPTGTEWLNRNFLREDRGAAFYNDTPIPYSAAFLASRAAFLLLSFGLVMASARKSMEFGTSRGWFGRFARRRKAVGVGENSEPADALSRSGSISLAELGMSMARRSWAAYMLTIARNEARHLVRGPGLWLFGVIIAFVATVTALFEPGPLDTNFLITSGHFAARSFGLITICTCLLSLFFGSDSFDRERSARTEAFVFSSPMPVSAWLVGKSLACAVIGFVVVGAAFAGMCIAMLWQGETWPEWAPLGIIWGLMLFPTFFFWSSFICLFRSFSANRYVTLALGFLVLSVTVWANARDYLNWANNWPLIGGITYSDISRFELRRSALVGNRVGAMLGGVFLLTLASVRMTKWQTDIVRARSRVGFQAFLVRYAPAIVAAMPMLGLSGWLYLNIRRGPDGAVTRKADRDYWRKNVATFFEFESPTIDGVDLDLVLDPATRSFRMNGSYRIRNHRDKPMREFPISIGRHLRDVKWTWNDKPCEPEDRSGLKVFRREDKKPIAPEETWKLGFVYEGTFPDGMNRKGTQSMEFIMPSGVVLTSFSRSFLPKLGFEPSVGLEDDMRPEPKNFPEDYYREKVDPAIGDGSKMTTKIAVTVPADFRANSVGTLESVVDQPDGTKKFVWVSDHPVSFFNVVAGRWTETAGEGVTIYHDPRHGRNVPEMLKALDAARKRYGEWFGAFPWKELKLSEFPGLADYAQGFPTNITFSESIGFKTISDEDSNAAYYVTAHEAAHQWWGNLLVPGAGPGGNILSESLANYSAIRLMEKELGERARIGLMREMESRYVMTRRSDDERPLVKIDGQKPTDQVITYERGGWVFWMLSRIMGEKAFHEGLAETIKKYPAGSADAPLVEDLLEVLRPHAADKAAFDRFVDQWVKGKDLPSLFFDDVKLVDGGNASGRKVTGKIRNDGTGTIEAEIAASLGDRFPKKKTGLTLTTSNSADKPYQEARTRVTLEAGKSAEFAIDCPFVPESVTFDPDLNVLMIGRDRSEKKL
jgi:hypothetical protein